MDTLSALRMRRARPAGKPPPAPAHTTPSIADILDRMVGTALRENTTTGDEDE